MPEDGTEAKKFIRGAMLAYPELYFARFVLLVEGDSERIVLPHIAKARKMLIDPAFVSIVPLGGRHVNHFWRLLSDLGIPHATLLDLDLGRTGGGFGRVKTVIEKLIEVGKPKLDLLNVQGNALSDEDLATMHNRKHAKQLNFLKSLIDHLTQYGVFFSMPLDFDLIMIRTFPDAYKAIVPEKGGPRRDRNSAINAVFGAKAQEQELYKEKFADCLQLLPDYCYHFLTRSKPASHLAALPRITPESSVETMHPSFRQIVEMLEYVTKKLREN